MRSHRRQQDKKFMRFSVPLGDKRRVCSKERQAVELRDPRNPDEPRKFPIEFPIEMKPIYCWNSVMSSNIIVPVLYTSVFNSLPALWLIRRVKSFTPCRERCLPSTKKPSTSGGGNPEAACVCFLANGSIIDVARAAAFARQLLLPADNCAGVLLVGGKPEGCFEGGADPHLHVFVAEALGGEAVWRGHQQALLRQASD